MDKQIYLLLEIFKAFKMPVFTVKNSQRDGDLMSCLSQPHLTKIPFFLP